MSVCTCGVIRVARLEAAEDDSVIELLLSVVMRLCAAEAWACVMLACAADACRVFAWSIAACAVEALA